MTFLEFNISIIVHFMHFRIIMPQRTLPNQSTRRSDSLLRVSFEFIRPRQGFLSTFNKGTRQNLLPHLWRKQIIRQRPTRAQMVQFQIIKISFRQIINLVHFFYSRNCLQRILTRNIIQTIQLLRCQIWTQKRQHINRSSIKISLIIHIFFCINWPTGKETELGHQRPLLWIFQQLLRRLLTLSWIICMQQNQHVNRQRLNITQPFHSQTTSQQKVVPTRLMMQPFLGMKKRHTVRNSLSTEMTIF
mmetsp:Transcript_3948/g.7591  ORF Transcript_3948/g.7591 Transcript_3948/m.7591 type:complete len:246 (+) Transcript_3948:3324-4061(+)